MLCFYTHWCFVSFLAREFPWVISPDGIPCLLTHMKDAHTDLNAILGMTIGVAIGKPRPMLSWKTASFIISCSSIAIIQNKKHSALF